MAGSAPVTGTVTESEDRHGDGHGRRDIMRGTAENPSESAMFMPGTARIMFYWPPLGGLSATVGHPDLPGG